MNILAEAQERFRGTSEEIRVLMSNSLLAIKRNDFDGAIQMLNEVPQSSSAYVHAQQAKANFYLDVRHDKRAYTQCFRDLVGLDPSARSYERLGAAYMHIQAPEAAIEAYEQAQNLDPRDASLAAKIGRTSPFCRLSRSSRGKVHFRPLGLSYLPLQVASKVYIVRYYI